MLDSHYLLSCCDMNTWPDVKKGVICGDCYALISISSYRNCRTYCDSLDLECSSAFDEVDPDTCNIETSHDCDTDFAWTSDALCQCSIGMSRTGIIEMYSKISSINFDGKLEIFINMCFKTPRFESHRWRNLGIHQQLGLRRQ